MGEAGEVVHYQVDAQAGREAVDGGVPEERGAEAVVGERGHVALDEDLRRAVRRHRVERRGLGRPAWPGRRRRRGCTTRRTGSARRRGLGQLRQPNRRTMVDGERAVRVEVAERVVGDGGQVDHRVEAGQMVSARVAQVEARLGTRRGRARGAPVEHARRRGPRRRDRRSRAIGAMTRPM